MGRGLGDRAVSGDLQLHWRVLGPVSEAYLRSRATIAVICGPVGSGKTSKSIQKMLMISAEQRVSPRPMTLEDGRQVAVRYTRWLVIRETYGELWSTTIPSWWEWIPQSFGQWVGGRDERGQHTLFFALQDGTYAHIEVDFMALGDKRIEDLLRGYQFTAAYGNELDVQPEEVFTELQTRWGRYPPARDGGASWYGIIGDMNAPDEDSWAYEAFWGIEEPDDDRQLFVQPSGLSPHAENLEAHPPNYYQKMHANLCKTKQGRDEARRKIENRPGISRKGDPVYDDWNDALHVSPMPLLPVRGIPLTIGIDAGGTPAATIWQRMPNGQWRGLAELWSAEDKVTGPERFARELLQLLTTRFAGFQAHGWVDPSAAYGVDRDDGKADWIAIVARLTRIRLRPAPTNSPTVRQKAIQDTLEDLIDGMHPGILIDKSMRVFRRAMVSGYRFARIKGQRGSRRAERPEKNFYSHTAESAEYALLGGSDYAELMGRERAQQAERGAQGGRAILDDGDEAAWAPVVPQGPRVTVGRAEPWDDMAEL